MFIEDVDKNVAGVYIIRCNKNGKIYIGSSKNIRERWKEHIKNLNSTNHHSMKLQKDWNEYGQNEFEFHILEKTDYANAKRLEEEYIQKFNAYDFGYNIRNFAKNVKDREKMKCDIILDCIKDTFVEDGNCYCYDFFKLAEKISLMPSDFLKFLNINSNKRFDSHRYLKENVIIGLNWDSEDIYITIFDSSKFSLKSEYIYIDI